MVWRTLLILSLLIAPVWANAESADDYFHAGVQDYIFGEKQKATTEINTGLQIYPTDPKLNEAWKLLQKKEQQDKQKNNKQDQKDQKDQKDQQDQKQDQQKSQQADQKKKDEEKAKQQQAKNRGDKDKDKQQQKSTGGKDKDDQKLGDEEQQAAAEAAMSPQEARQLLDSQQDKEKVLIFAPENQTAKPQPGKFKDW